jgi:hypothetical protein
LKGQVLEDNGVLVRRDNTASRNVRWSLRYGIIQQNTVVEPLRIEYDK